jgi:TPR repeat protein
MKQTALVIIIFFLGIITAQGHFLALSHQIMREQKRIDTINELISHLTHIKNNRSIKEIFSTKDFGRELKKAYKNYEDGAFSVSFPIFKKQADNGNATAIFLLSRCYRYGRGTAIDIEKADSLVFEAACRGLNDAIELLQIEREMSKNDVIDWLINIIESESAILSKNQQYT